MLDNRSELTPGDAAKLSISLWSENRFAKIARKNIRAHGLPEIKYHLDRLEIPITPAGVVYTQFIIAAPHRANTDLLNLLAKHRVYVAGSQNPVLVFTKFLAANLECQDQMDTGPYIDRHFAMVRHAARDGFDHASFASLIEAIAGEPGRAIHERIGAPALAWEDAHAS